MDLYTSFTSPYARIVRIALREKGIWDRVRQHAVDPWADAPDLMRVNPLVRVPTLVTEAGEELTESLLIVHYLERRFPEPALVPDAQAGVVLARAGRALGVIDAAVAILVGRKIASDFDRGAVGERRWRNIRLALTRMEEDPPEAVRGRPDLSAIATAVALDYLPFRFPQTDWLEGRPKLKSLRESLRDRPSLVETMPPA